MQYASLLETTSTVGSGERQLERLNMERYNSSIVFAALYLREASKEIESIEPEMSLALLKSADALLHKHSIGEGAVEEAKELADELRRDS